MQRPDRRASPGNSNLGLFIYWKKTRQNTPTWWEFHHDELFIACFCCLNSLHYHQGEPGRAQISCMTALSSGVNYYKKRQVIMDENPCEIAGPDPVISKAQFSPNIYSSPFIYSSSVDLITTSQACFFNGNMTPFWNPFSLKVLHYTICNILCHFQIIIRPERRI